MDPNDSRPSSIKSMPRRSSDAQLLPNGTANTTATPEKSFPDSPLLMMSDKRRSVRLDCMSDDTIDSLATTGRASISVIDDDWSFDKGTYWHVWCILDMVCRHAGTPNTHLQWLNDQSRVPLCDKKRRELLCNRLFFVIQLCKWHAGIPYTRIGAESNCNRMYTSFRVYGLCNRTFIVDPVTNR